MSQPLDSSSQYSQSYPHSNQFGNSSWCVDSGATNHITSSLNNLSLHSPYHGIDKVAIGNGKTLPISNVGISQMLTHTTPISILSLPNVLHVPNMTKNFISVSQLTNEKNVIAEFHSTFCLIKDKETGQVLFRGCLKTVFIDLLQHLLVLSLKLFLPLHLAIALLLPQRGFLPHLFQFVLLIVVTDRACLHLVICLAHRHLVITVEFANSGMIGWVILLYMY